MHVFQRVFIMFGNQFMIFRFMYALKTCRNLKGKFEDALLWGCCVEKVRVSSPLDQHYFHYLPEFCTNERMICLFLLMKLPLNYF